MTKLMQFLEAALTPKTTAKDLAAQLGVHQSLITLWRQGKRKPGRDKIKRLAKISGIKVEDLL